MTESASALDSLNLAGVGFWTRAPGTQTLPEAAILNARTRGRASLLTLMFAEVLAQAAREANLEHGSFATIYGSAFGEMERLMQLLQGMQGTPPEVSPLRFQTSVHNTAAGQISIASKNTQFSTSLAAGHSTVAMGFIEAAAWMQSEQAPLVLVVGDEDPPARLHPGDSYAPMAAAFAFVPTAAHTPAMPRLRIRRGGEGRQGDCNLRHNPCAMVEPLINWLARGSVGVFSLSGHGNTAYCIQRL